jgi:hypothetical protein
VKISVLLPLLRHTITYRLLFLRGTFSVGGEETVSLPLLCHETTYPLLFLHGTSGVGGEEICAATTPLPRNHLPAAVSAWSFWCRW